MAAPTSFSRITETPTYADEAADGNSYCRFSAENDLFEPALESLTCL